MVCRLCPAFAVNCGLCATPKGRSSFRAYTNSSSLRLSTTSSLTSSCASCARATTLPHWEAAPSMISQMARHSPHLSCRRIPIPATGSFRSCNVSGTPSILSVSSFPLTARCSWATPFSGRALPVFEDLGDYLASLQKLLNASDIYETINPGHRPVVPDGPRTIRMYTDHRLEREAHIVALDRSANSRDPT